jgi:hypothetical protein
MYNWLNEEGPEILGIDLELTNPADPYGSLREGSGRLTLNARILPAVPMPPERSVGTYNARLGFLAMNDSPDVYMTLAKYDTSDPDDGDEKHNTVLLEFSSKCGEHAWSCKGVVLRSIDGKTFKRRGVFDFSTREGRRRDESLEAWQQRVDREYNWFKCCTLEVIHII